MCDEEQDLDPKEKSYRPFVWSAHDREWAELQDKLARTICQVFGVSLQDLGLTTKGTYPSQPYYDLLDRLHLSHYSPKPRP